jgi:[ribosomal protein S5]-alanine N-acetyltransferase
MLTVNFDPFPVITTDRLLLRRVEMADVPEIQRLRSDEQLMKYIHRPRFENATEAAAFVEKIHNMVAANEGIGWGITRKDDPKVIGHISFHILYKEHYRAEAGYMLFAEYHRKGIITEALQAILHYGFTAMGLHSVEAITDGENSASRKLLEKSGFIQEGYFRESTYWEGRFHDKVVYSLLNNAAAKELPVSGASTLPV